MSEAKFENRWLIEGQLTVVTPLRIGCGDLTTRERLRNSETHQPIEIAANATDANGCAYIPASTIKGRLRAWARESGVASFDDLFGSEDTREETAVGGKVEFHDASAISIESLQPKPARWPPQAPYWDASRLTGVAAGVAIDRRTRTANDKKLFHYEFVPPGVGFNLIVTAQNLNDDETDDLLFILNGLNVVTLGAAVNDGWGQLRWELTTIKRKTADEVAAWIAGGGAGVGNDVLKKIDDDEFGKLKAKAGSRAVAACSKAFIQLDLLLDFQSNFLVNDPSQVRTAEEFGEENALAHAPLRNAEGRAFLPASSIRGAFRGQAERILRTIGNERSACYFNDEDETRPTCKAVYDKNKLKHLCPACQVFGANGWRSPIHFTDFIPASEPMEMTQEFLAIDRFTGGGADGAKFNAQSVYKPQLRGSIAIDLDALRRAGTGRWALGLLLLVMRDVVEGDVRMGFGAAKGYGTARARIETITLPDWNDIPEEFRKDLRESHWAILKREESLNDEVKEALKSWIGELSQRAKAVGDKQ